MPYFLQRFTKPLRDAPATHVTAFLVLHELTAVVPLFGLVALFHSTQWLPSSLSDSQVVMEATKKFGKYFTRKGWLTTEESVEGGSWGVSERGMRIVVEYVCSALRGIPQADVARFATAYAITKILLPLRLVLSVWATPWFARYTVAPCVGLFRRMFRTSPKVKPALPPVVTDAAKQDAKQGWGPHVPR